MTMTRQEEITLARLVDMQLKIDGMERATLRRLSKYYKTAIKGLLADVKRARGKSARLWTNTRLIALLEETQLQHQAIINTMTRTTAAASVAAGAFSYENMNNLISWDGAVKTFNQVSLTVPQMTQLVTSQKLGGKLLGDWIGDALKPNLFPIVDELKQGFIKGQSYDKIARRIRQELDFLPGSKKARDMETIVKTYIQSMQVNAMDDVYAANKDIVKKVEWSAIMEPGNTKTGRGTCPRCMALDGQQWITDSPTRPSMPLHARCRCVWYPITLTWDELGLDGGEMEDVYQPWVIRDLERKDRRILAYGTTDKNYAGFWKQQDRAFQNNAIGPVRAGMVREGLIEFQDIVDNRTGDLILIKDLPGFVPKKKVVIPKPKKKPVSPKKPVKKPAKKKVAPKPPTIYPIPGTNTWTNLTSQGQFQPYHDKFLKEVDDWVFMEKTDPKWESGAFHNGITKKINMGSHKEDINGASTFLHEFGHRVDAKIGPEIHNQWPRHISNNVSGTEKYWTAMLDDQTHLNKLFNDSFKALGGTGRRSRRKIQELSFIRESELVGEFFERGLNDKKLIIEQIKKDGVKPEYQSLLNLTDTLVAQNPDDVLFIYNMYLDVALASKHDAPSFILDRWLGKANAFCRKGDGIPAQLSDAVGGTTKEKFGVGHGTAYYNDRPAQRSKEAFAQIFSSRGLKDADDFFKRYMPNQIRIFDEFLEMKR